MRLLRLILIMADSKTSKVEDILLSLKKSKATATHSEDEIETKVRKKNMLPEVPRGKPKSGRIWKSQKQKFSSVNKTKGAHQTFAEKENLRLKMKQIREASKEILEQKKAAREAAKERRRKNMKKAEENRLKAEIVQVISNPAKIKRMKKKQLRFIEKRDTTVISK